MSSATKRSYKAEDVEFEPVVIRSDLVRRLSTSRYDCSSHRPRVSFDKDWKTEITTVHPSLPPVKSTLSPSGHSHSSSATKTGNDVQLKPFHLCSASDSDKENVDIRLSKRRRVVVRSSMRGELSAMRHSLERVERNQTEIFSKLEKLQEALDVSMGRLSDILEGGSSQVMI